jgi:hypothetical protein
MTPKGSHIYRIKRSEFDPEGVAQNPIQKIISSKKIRMSNIATHLYPALNPGNSYPQMGHSFAEASTSMAHDGHSRVFIFLIFLLHAK